MSRIAVHFGLRRGAEEGAYPLRSVTDEQQSQRPKWTQPSGPGFLGVVALSLARHVAAAMLLTRLRATTPRSSRCGHAVFADKLLAEMDAGTAAKIERGFVALPLFIARQPSFQDQTLTPVDIREVALHRRGSSFVIIKADK